MRKHGGWLRKIIKPLFKATQRRNFVRSRRVWLEQLESRYVLTAPVAVNDAAVGEVNTLAQPRNVQILALDNDTDTDSLHSVLKIVEAAGQDVSLATGNVTIPLTHGSLQVIYQNSHLEHFIYTPNINFTGTETFTYRISDGAPPFSDPATVTIHVNPVAAPGDYTIYEGGLTFDTHQGLVLDGSASRGPGLTYFWSIDSHSLGPVGGSTSPTLPVSWSDLNNVGIVNGGTSTLTLQVQDSNGNTASSSTTFEIVDFAPEVSVLDVGPGGAGCGTALYHLSATFAEPNPLESPLQVWVDWDYDISTEDFTSGISSDAEQLTGYTPNGLNGFNFPQFSIQADHTYTTDGSRIVFIWVLAPVHTFGPPSSEVGFNVAFIDVLTGGGGLPQDVAISGAPTTSPEGSQISLRSSFTGGCGTPVYAWSVSKDGSNTPHETGAQQNFSFTPNDDGSYVVSLTVDGVPAEEQTMIVNNVAPTLTLSGDSSVNEGSSYTLNLSPSDPGADTITSWTINWGDGTQVVTGNPSSITHTYADGSNNYTITASATDEDDTFTAGNTVAIAVNNVAPSLTISGAASVNEGSSYTLNLSSSDPGADTISKWTINWGDGTELEEVSGNPSSVTHTYADGNSTSNYTISATATDEDGTFAAGNSVPVTVNNVAPSILTFSVIPAATGSPEVTLSGTFGDPGSAESYSILVTWESGVTETITRPAGSTSFSVSHTYTSTGVKEISATVADDDDGQSAAVASNLTVQAALNGGSLSVLGLGGDDQIALTPGSVIVTINGIFVGEFNVASGVSVSAGDGNDTISVTAGITVPVTILGQAGNDTVVVVGTNGNDTITQTSTGFVANGTVINTGAGVEGATVNGGTGVDQFIATGTPPVPVQVQAISDMVIVGTGGNDQISFTPGAVAGVVIGKLNDQIVSQFSPTGSLIGRGEGGNDDLQVAGGIGLSAWLYGGLGNDRLKGGGGNDVLLGEAGNDLLVGGNGRDLMIGALGEDRLVGDPGDDILIAGTTNYDGNDNELAAIMSVWTSSQLYLARILQLACLLDNSGSNATVHDDNSKDTLTGSSGNDWFFANLLLDSGDDADTRDKITDLSFIEALFAQDIDFIES